MAPWQTSIGLGRVMHEVIRADEYGKDAAEAVDLVRS
jgi:hypothetical protein